MSEQKIKNIIETISNMDGIYIQGKHSDGEISEAEFYLSIKFPEEFKLYLKNFGNISFDGKEYYGLTKNNDYKNSGVPNFVWFTLRKRAQSNFPDKYLIFKNNNDDIYYCLSSCEDEIYIWDNISKSMQDTIKCSFLDFLISDLTEE